jgi:hypothetical protein
MRKMILSFVISLLTMVSINAQNLTKREVYQSLEMGQKQLIHKTISSYWDYSLYADTVEVHQFLGWLDTVTTPGVWVGEWAVFPCKKIFRNINQGNGSSISDVLYFIAGNAANEIRTISDIDSLYDITYHAFNDISEAILIDSTSEFWIGDTDACIDSITKVNKQIQYFGLSTSGEPRYTSSETKRGVGEVMYRDSIPNSNPQLFSFPEYSEKREQILFEDSHGQCSDEAVVFKESIADEGLTLYDINNFDVGDEFIYSESYGSHDMMGGWSTSTSYSYVKITAKQETSNEFIYTYDKHVWSDAGDQWNMNLEMNLSKLGHIDPTLSSVTYLPNGMTVFYDSLCHLPTWNWSWDEYLWDTWYQRSEGYGKGLGHINSYTYQMNYSHSLQLVDFRKNGMACGDWMEMSVAKEEGQKSWRVFPTLVSNEVDVISPSGFRNVQYQIHDQWGRILESEYLLIDSEQQQNTLSFLNYPSGVYFLSFLAEGDVQSIQRVIKLQ